VSSCAPPGAGLIERAMACAEQRHAQELEAWIAERREVATELLGKPAEDVTPEDVRHCSVVYGRPDPFDQPPRLRLDLRYVPRGPVVVRRTCSHASRSAASPVASHRRGPATSCD
jgi:hypothetical protein